MTENNFFYSFIFCHSNGRGVTSHDRFLYLQSPSCDFLPFCLATARTDCFFITSFQQFADEVSA